MLLLKIPLPIGVYFFCFIEVTLSLLKMEKNHAVLLKTINKAYQ